MNQNEPTIFNENELKCQYCNKIFSTKDFKIVSKRKPTLAQLKNLIFAFNICRYVKSNAIVIANDKSSLGIGSGQQNRLDSCKIAIEKMNKFQNINENDEIIAASDAFFPFPNWFTKRLVFRFFCFFF